jgi:hypothetical protein
MALDAHNAADRVDQMIILVERLTESVAQQCKCFEQHRPIEAGQLMDEISRLANLYRHESARVRAEPQLVAAAPLELRRRLMRASEAFDAVLHRHGRAVNAARTVTEGLVRTIAEEVASRREQLSGYGPTAKPPSSAAGAATAITLNQRA